MTRELVQQMDISPHQLYDSHPKQTYRYASNPNPPPPPPPSSQPSLPAYGNNVNQDLDELVEGISQLDTQDLERLLELDEEHEFIASGDDMNDNATTPSPPLPYHHYPPSWNAMERPQIHGNTHSKEEAMTATYTMDLHHEELQELEMAMEEDSAHRVDSPSHLSGERNHPSSRFGQAASSHEASVDLGENFDLALEQGYDDDHPISTPSPSPPAASSFPSEAHSPTQSTLPNTTLMDENPSYIHQHDEPPSSTDPVEPESTPWQQASPSPFTPQHSDKNTSWRAHYSMEQRPLYSANNEFQTMNELEQKCAMLQSINDRLMREAFAYKEEIQFIQQDSQSRCERVSSDAKARMADLQQYHEGKVRSLESEVASLSGKVEASQKEESSIAAIKASLMEEKEMDILLIKKELTAAKEAQLQSLAAQVEEDKQSLLAQHTSTLQSLKGEHSAVIQSKDAALASLQSQLDAQAEKMAFLKDHVELLLGSFPPSGSALPIHRQIMDKIRNYVQNTEKMLDMYQESPTSVVSLTHADRSDSYAHGERSSKRVSTRSSHTMTAPLCVTRSVAVMTDALIDQGSVVNKNNVSFFPIPVDLSFEREAYHVSKMSPKHESELIEEEKQAHKNAIQELRVRYENEMTHLKQRHAASEKEWRKTCDTLRANLTLIKADFSKVFQDAIQKFKHDFAQKHSTANNKMQAELDRLQSKLEESISIQEHETQLTLAKEQYLNTLKRMRDDLAQDRMKAVQLGEVEWKSMKAGLYDDYMFSDRKSFGSGTPCLGSPSANSPVFAGHSSLRATPATGSGSGPRKNTPRRSPVTRRPTSTSTLTKGHRSTSGLAVWK